MVGGKIALAAIEDGPSLTMMLRDITLVVVLMLMVPLCLFSLERKHLKMTSNEFLQLPCTRVQEWHVKTCMPPAVKDLHPVLPKCR